MVLLTTGMTGLLTSVSLVLAHETARFDIVVDEPTVVDAPAVVDDPAFPGVLPREVIRLWAGPFFAPEARFDD